MKRIFYLIIVLAIIFCGCANKANDNVTQKSPIKINMPKDNTVNGYRNQDTDMPDIIDSQTVMPQGDTNLTISYCGNKNSKKFHRPSCTLSQKINDENLYICDSLEELIEGGYEPCKRCNP